MTQENTTLNENISNIKSGDTIKVYQIIKEAEKPGKKGKEDPKKEKIQVFEGLVLARKHGKEPGSTITVRKVIDGIGVEKIFPLHSPMIKKIEIVKRSKVRRAKLYYLREAKGKRARLKTLAFTPEKSKKIEKVEKIKEIKKEKTEVIESTEKNTQPSES
ncbi:MAG: 50S ribosomal protein L19 [Patescibacteria group bacterium]|nr:50S ribosomal protein L19 [Patescibacteria group bacterium]